MGAADSQVDNEDNSECDNDDDSSSKTKIDDGQQGCLEEVDKDHSSGNVDVELKKTEEILNKEGEKHINDTKECISNENKDITEENDNSTEVPEEKTALETENCNKQSNTSKEDNKNSIDTGEKTNANQNIKEAEDTENKNEVITQENVASVDAPNISEEKNNDNLRD